MSAAVSMWAGSFLFGSATGALLMRLQWMTFKKDLLRELGEQSAVSVDYGSRDSGRLNETDYGGRRVDESHTASYDAPDLQEFFSPNMIVDSPLGALLEKKQIEIDSIRHEIQALRTVLPLLEHDPDKSEEGFPHDFSDTRQGLQAKYGSWLSPRSPRSSE